MNPTDFTSSTSSMRIVFVAICDQIEMEPRDYLSARAETDHIKS